MIALRVHLSHTFSIYSIIDHFGAIALWIGQFLDLKIQSSWMSLSRCLNKMSLSLGRISCQSFSLWSAACLYLFLELLYVSFKLNHADIHLKQTWLIFCVLFAVTTIFRIYFVSRKLSYFILFVPYLLILHVSIVFDFIAGTLYADDRLRSYVS